MLCIDQVVTDRYAIYRGDCVQLMEGMPSDSVGFSVFSPPFASLYTYSDDDRDMGNCRDGDEFAAQFRFAVDQLYRVMAPGRLIAIHCMNLPSQSLFPCSYGSNTHLRFGWTSTSPTHCSTEAPGTTMTSGTFAPCSFQ
jgi:hypothetical protein